MNLGGGILNRSLSFPVHGRGTASRKKTEWMHVADRDVLESGDSEGRSRERSGVGENRSHFGIRAAAIDQEAGSTDVHHAVRSSVHAAQRIVAVDDGEG